MIHSHLLSNSHLALLAMPAAKHRQLEMDWDCQPCSVCLDDLSKHWSVWRLLLCNNRADPGFMEPPPYVKIIYNWPMTVGAYTVPAQYIVLCDECQERYYPDSSDDSPQGTVQRLTRVIEDNLTSGSFLQNLEGALGTEVGAAKTTTNEETP